MTLSEAQRRATTAFSAGEQECVGPVCAGTDRSILERIRKPGIALAVWQRDLEADFLAELEPLALDILSDVLLDAPIDGLKPILAAATDEAGYGEVPRLRHDISELAERHAAIAETGSVRIRLEIIETDACRKFHSDYVTVRTISTYRGQGTHWVRAKTPASAADAPIEQLEAGWVGMFKGRIWQREPTILHRSPPLSSSGERRLLLVIDPIPSD